MRTPHIDQARLFGTHVNRRSHQIERNRDEPEQRGVTVHAVHHCIESGWDNDHWMDRAVLADAVAKAKELGAVLVAETLSRIIRSERYHPSDSLNA